ANTASLSAAFAHAPDGEEGAVSSSVLISDLFFPAASIGIGGALVALGATYEGGEQLGIVLAFGLSFLLALLLLASAYRLPSNPVESPGH
ncbi:MAG: MFS transporter, partial [Rubrobacter sp.]